jgi:hypothetical protein
VAAAKKMVNTMRGSSAPSAAAAKGFAGMRLSDGLSDRITRQRQKGLHDPHAEENADHRGSGKEQQRAGAESAEFAEVAHGTDAHENH